MNTCNRLVFLARKLDIRVLGLMLEKNPKLCPPIRYNSVHGSWQDFIC